MHADARVMATLGGVRSEEENRQYLQTNIDHWERNGFGIWVFFDSQGQFIGRGGLRRISIEGEFYVELNYSVAADCWGKGFASEMGQGILGVAFEVLHLPDVVAFTQPTNARSRRVMEKIGMTYKREFLHLGSTAVLYIV